MNEHLTKEFPIRLEECQIKRARRGEKMEIQLKDNTALKRSSKMFDVSLLEFDEGYLGLPTTVLGRPQTPIPNPNPNPTPIPYPNTNLGHPRTLDGNPGYV